MSPALQNTLHTSHLELGLQCIIIRSTLTQNIVSSCTIQIIFEGWSHLFPFKTERCFHLYLAFDFIFLTSDIRASNLSQSKSQSWLSISYYIHSYRIIPIVIKTIQYRADSKAREQLTGMSTALNGLSHTFLTI